MQPDVLCIYHKGCFDGFTAAWVVHRRMKALGITVVFHEAAYGDEPPYDLAEGQDVLIVDFSWPRTELAKLAKVARTLVVLDHHKTAKTELEGLTLPRTKIVFNMELSGCQLAWDEMFSPGGRADMRPMLVEYVGRRDALWDFSLPDAHAVNAYVANTPMTFEAWSNLAENLEIAAAYDEIVEIGGHLIRQRDRFITDAIKATLRMMPMAGYTVPVVNLPHFFASEACQQMLRDYGDAPFVASYFDSEKGRAFSLRSMDERADVSAIAKHYGGGHRNAAGFLAPAGWEGEL